MSTSRPPDADSLRRIKRRIGELLIDEGLVELAHVEEALSIQKRDGRKTVDILIDCGFLDTATFEQFMNQQSDSAAIGLSNYNLVSEIYGLVPQNYLISHEVIPADKAGKTLTLGMVCPIDWRTIDEVAEMTGLNVSPFLCKSDDIYRAFKTLFDFDRDSV